MNRFLIQIPNLSLNLIVPLILNSLGSGKTESALFIQSLRPAQSKAKVCSFCSIRSREVFLGSPR